MSESKSSERRDGPRIDLRLRVRYEAGDVSGEAEASDVSPKGLRIESEKPVAKGTALKLTVDAGEAEELSTVGTVTWCRAHTTPMGKTLYHLGVAFESDWLARDRGPLGSALARIFALNSYEPARQFERTAVSLAASVASPASPMEVVNISLGGMQLRSKGALNDAVRPGVAVRVEVDVSGAVHRLQSQVVWLAAAQAGGPDASASSAFGLEFSGLGEEELRLVDGMRTAGVQPTRITLFVEV